MKKINIYLITFLLLISFNTYSQWSGTAPTWILNSNVGIGTQTPDLRMHIVSKDLSFTSQNQSTIVPDPLQLRLSYLKQTNLNPECFLPPGQCPVMTVADMDWDVTNSGPLDFSFYNNLTSTNNIILSLTEDHSFFNNVLNANNGFNASSGTISNFTSAQTTTENLIVNGPSIFNGPINSNLTINNGNITISGTNSLTTGTTEIKLYSNGNIRAREIKVDYASIPDYVFRPNYKLMPLDKLEAYVKKNNHLPNIKSESEYKSSEGIELGELNLKLLEKVEELTLYAIQQQKEINELKQFVTLTLKK